MNVHLITPPRATQADIAEGMKHAHKIMEVDVTRMTAAHAWLQEKNSNYNNEESVRDPIAFKDLPTGTVQHTVGAESSAEGAKDVSTGDQSAGAQTVFTATQSNARSSVIVAEGAEALLKAGKYTHTTSSGQTVVYAATSIYQYWDPQKVSGCYVYEMPFGISGPEIERKKPLSRKAWVIAKLSLSHGAFARHPDFLLQEFTVLRNQSMYGVRSQYLKSNPQLSSNIMSVSEADIAAAAKYQDAVKLAREHRKPTPAKPDDVTAPAQQALFTAELPLNFQYGTQAYAVGHRNMLFSMQTFYGIAHTWSTTTPPDLENLRFYARTGVDPNPSPTPASKAQRIADDPPAVAKTFLDQMEIFIKYFYGWDSRNNCSIKGGGLLGTFLAWAIMIEDQQRQSPHWHTVACNYGLPRTLDELMEWIRSPTFCSDILKFAGKVMDETPGLTIDEVTEYIANKKHIIATHPDSGVICSERNNGVVPPSGSVDFNALGGSGPVKLKDTIVVKGLEKKDAEPTKKWEDDQRPPHNLKCIDCGHTFSAHVEAENLALDIVGEEIATKYKASKIEFSAVFVDVVNILEGGRYRDADEARFCRAVCTLIVTMYNEHHHKKSCFKNKKKKKPDSCKQHSDDGHKRKLTCRYGIPLPRKHSFAIVVNDTLYITVENCAEVALPDYIFSIEYQFGTSPFFPYTASHNNIHSMIFQGNTNMSLHSACNGAMWYISNYMTKLPQMILVGTKQVTSWHRQVMREAREDANRADDDTTSAADLQRRRASQRVSAISSVNVSGIEVSSTMAAIYIFHGSTLTMSQPMTPLNVAVSLFVRWGGERVLHAAQV